MRFKKIKDTETKDFKQAWKIYQYSFPSDEKRTLNVQRNYMKDKRYNFYAVYKNGLAGFITDWDFGDFLYVQHLAVDRELRGQGIGTELLKKYLRNKKVVLEVERPTNETAKKRIKFYKKLGFHLNKFNYIQPPCGKGKKALPMYIMTYPEKINKREFNLIKDKLYRVIYGK